MSVIGYEPPSYEAKWNRKDAILYALGTGAAGDDLKYIFEGHEDFSVMPTFLSCLPFKGVSDDVIPFPPKTLRYIPPGLAELGPNLSGGLFGEQTIEFYDKIPLEAEVVCQPRITGFRDLGNSALMETETIVTVKGSSKPLARMVAGSVFRGLGGFSKTPKGAAMAGGSPPSKVTLPSRDPDIVQEVKTQLNQSMIFRLSGDYNALHIDPEFAQSFGFKTPIMHGLATCGFVTRAVLKHCCNNDPSNLLSIGVRFVNPVIPGETLVIKIWAEGGRFIMEASSKERNKVVLNNAFATVKLNAFSHFLRNVKGKESGKSSSSTLATVPTAKPSASTSAPIQKIFANLSHAVKVSGPKLVKEINGIIQFDISDPESNWVVNLKQGNGSVSEGKFSGKPDLVLSLSASTFVDLVEGKLDGTKAFMSRKITAKGNMALAMKFPKLLAEAKKGQSKL